MSRAFVKEADGDDRIPERPRRRHSDLPNYITPRGEHSLRDRIERLAQERVIVAAQAENLNRKSELLGIDEDLDYLRERLQRAILVPPPPRPWETVEVGASIEFIDTHGEIYQFTIVGEDEIDVALGQISWTSPLGRAVLRRSVGDAVTWPRPIGDLEVEILSITYKNCSVQSDLDS